MKNLTIILASLAAVSVTGCAVTTAGVKKGDERNFARSVNDVSAGRAIKARMTRAYDFDLNKVDVEVAEGIAVLTGSVPGNEDRIEAERIAWSGPHIVQVGNEIQLNSKKGIIRGSKDSVLGARIKSRLIAEKNVKARNVNIETHNGVVYLMGVARDQSELERIAYIASTTDGTKEVVSYIKIAGQPVTTNASFSSAPRSLAGASPNIPYLPAPGAAPAAPSLPSAPMGMNPSIPQLPTPNQRALPPSLSTTPQLPGGEQQAQPFFRDPHTGEKVILPPGTRTVPFNPTAGLAGGANEAPFYIDPSNGKKVQIVYTGE